MGTPFKILLVDDEDDILQILEEIFSSKGYLVKTAKNGIIAKKILQNEEFDLVLSDYRMPEGNGVFVLSYVNSMEKKPFFFFMSAYSPESDQNCINQGADKYIQKPFSIDYIVKEVDQTLLNSNKIRAEHLLE